MVRSPLLRAATLGLALLVLLVVFSLYLRPEFMVMLAQQAWACF